MHAAIKQYIDAHQQRFLAELFDWLRIPSVSAKSEHKADVLHAAQWLAGRLSALGLDNVALLPTTGFPVVFGEKIIDPALPTILMYGHYDVQPAEPLELWKSPAFEPEIRDGKIWARGACDDKGQAYMHVKALETLLANGPLPCNVKFFVEGEEEVGSASLGPALRQYKDKLKCDVLVISDTSMIANDVPSICVALRGLAYVEVEVTGPSRDLHSGVYGGAVDNPVNVLCEMIAKLKDGSKRITIPGFYDDVRELSAAERAEIARIPFSEADYLKKLDLRAVAGEKGYSTLERASTRPTLDVNGIWGGYTGEGTKTVLPAKAFAKISMRLVANQDPEKVFRQFAAYFPTLAPPTVTVKVHQHHGGQPFETDTNSTGYRAAEAAMTQSFGIKPIPAREGGSIPIMALFKEVLGVPVVLMGFGLDTDALHSPNENYGVFNYLKGIETIALFHHQFAALHKR
jgi:acetylornithine deacetylase/succinyl-diaminopimelate desuccinylase-like protein